MNQSRLRMLMVQAFAVAVLLPLMTAAGAEQVDGEAAFERIKALTGAWKASDKPGAPVSVEFHVTGGGRAVIETQYPGTDREMVSVYYLDEDRLVLTHYCTTGNQPHLKLDTAASTADTYRFVFDGGTNLGSTYAPHLHQGTLRFLEGDKVDAEWLFFVDGKPAKEPVHLVLQRGG